MGAIDANERDPAVLGETISALEVAANQAAAASASLEASELLQAAVELSTRLPGGPETLQQRLHLQAGLAFGLATFRGYGDPSVEAAYSAALDLANESENSPDLAFTIYGVLSFFTARGDYARAMPIARRLQLLAKRFGDLRLASIAHQSRAIIAILRGRVTTGASLATRSIEDADRIGSGMFFPHGGAGDFRTLSGTWLALSLAIAGRRSEAEAAYAGAFALSETNAFGRGFVKSFCPLPVLARQHAAAMAFAGDIVADADARGLALFAVVGGVYSGWAAARLGHDDARVGGFLNAKIHIAQAMGLGSFTPWFLALAAEAYLLRGDLDAAQKAIETAEASILQSGGSLFSTEVTRWHARVTLARGDREAATGLLRDAEERARRRVLTLFAELSAADARDLVPERAETAPQHAPERPTQAATGWQAPKRILYRGPEKAT